MTCRVCGAGMRARGPYARCPSCAYWASDLEHDVQSTSAPDAEYELVSYEHTRRANYAAMLALLAKRHAPGSRLLEIGCADGLFLAMARDYVALGIEPNARMMQGNPFAQEIRCGFFPEALGAAELRFDVIALHCVFEHVPDVDAMIESLKLHLAPGGSILINVPVSSGLLFRLARALRALGIEYPFDRLWQKGFVSPHLHYFARPSLTRLFASHGLRLVDETPLAFFSLGGIYRRLGLDPSIRLGQRVATLAGLYAYYPLARLLPDARAFVFAAR